MVRQGSGASARTPLGGESDGAGAHPGPSSTNQAIEQIKARRIELGGFIDINPLVTHASKGGSLDGESLIGVADSLGVTQKQKQ